MAGNSKRKRLDRPTPSKNGQPSTKDLSPPTSRLNTRLPVFTGLNEAATTASSKSTYLDAYGGFVAQFGHEEDDDTIVKNALLIVEGTHKDNRGVTHQFTPQRVQQLAKNTNAAIASGYEIPFMADHSKELLSNGQLKRLGDLSSDLECRIITALDLPNPKMTHLLGKMGAFAKVTVRTRVDDVRRGLIKLLSPGIDLVNDRIAEVSAVALPAIHGPALFQAPRESLDKWGQPYSRLLVGSRYAGCDGWPHLSIPLVAHFSLDYDEAKKQAEAIKKQKSAAQECFDICFSVLESIDAVPVEQMLGTDPNALKLSAVQKFMLDLLALLQLDSVEQEPSESSVVPTNTVTRTAYSVEEEDEEMIMKSRQRKANFSMAKNAKLLFGSKPSKNGLNKAAKNYEE